MKKFCELHALNKKNQLELNENANSAIFLEKKLKINMLNIKYIVNLGTIVVIQGNIKVLHITYII